MVVATPDCGGAGSVNDELLPIANGLPDCALHFEAVDHRGVDGDFPRATDTEVAAGDRGVIDRKEPTLIVVRLDRAFYRDPAHPDLVIDPFSDAKHVRVPRIRRPLDAWHDQHVGIVRLHAAVKREPAVRVVLGQGDEIQTHLLCERKVLGYGRRRIPALPTVHMEVARIPARLVAQHAWILVRRTWLWRKRSDGAKEDLDPVECGKLVDPSLADDHLPGACRHRPRDVAPRSCLHPDDRRLAVASAPPPETVWIVQAPVEDVARRQVVMADLDLDDALRDLERNEEVCFRTRGNLARENEVGLLPLCRAGKQHGENHGPMKTTRHAQDWNPHRSRLQAPKLRRSGEVDARLP